MQIEEFANITLGELQNKMNGFNKAKTSRLQREMDNALFIERWQVTISTNLTRAKKDWIKETDLYLFDWEKESVKLKAPSKERREEWRAITEKWKALDNKKVAFNTPEEMEGHLKGLNK